MSDRAIVGTVRVGVAIGGGLAVGGSVLLIVAGEADVWFREFLAAEAVIAVCFGAFAWFLIPSQTRNAAVWTMAVASATGLTVAGSAVAAVLVGGNPLDVAPADLPEPAAWILVVSFLAWGVGLNAVFTFGFLLFPDGRLPSPRWRGVGLLAAASIALVSVGVAVRFRPTNTEDPFADGGVVAWGVDLLLLCALLSLVALVRRLWRSHGQSRQQFKWVVWGTSLAVPTFVITVLLGEGPHEHLIGVPFLVALALLLVCYGVAVGNYRLFDIDVVISRTLLYGALAGCVTGIYVMVVVGFGQLVGDGRDPNTALALASTAVVAVVFQPLRDHFQRAVDRLVHGRTVTPHQVLSEFSRQVALTDEALLEQVARSLVQGTAADHAGVWMLVERQLVHAAQWPQEPAEPGLSPSSFPIEHDGVNLGWIRLSAPAGQRLSEEDMLLADKVASGLGAALRNRSLTGTLRGRIEQLRESRRRLAAAQDETRRRVARDLHDGAQQQLVALKVKLGLAQVIADRDGATATASRLAELATLADAAVEAMRDFTRDLYPPLLESEGLAAAITAYVRGLPAAVGVEVGGLRRYDGETEATVYFCVADLLSRIAEVDPMHATSLHISDTVGAITFAVTVETATGTHHDVVGNHWVDDIIDRVGAANGTLRIHIDGRTAMIHGELPGRPVDRDVFAAESATMQVTPLSEASDV